MKGITKDYQTITKDYEILFYSMKDQRMKDHVNFALHLRLNIPIPQYWLEVFCIYDIIAAFKLSCKIFHIYDTSTILYRESPAFTSALIISLYDITFYKHKQHIFSHNI